jgi:D-alanine-D-alanine ligase
VSKTPRILAITNENPAWAEVDKQQGDDAWKALVSGLAEEGRECRAVKFFDDLGFLDDFDPRQWLVWNWGEELAGRPWSDAEVADELERRGFAYTGASARLIRQTQDRLAVKQRLQAAGLPTLVGAVLRDPVAMQDGAISNWTVYPAIVKGANQHASVGIDSGAIVSTPAELARRVAWLRETHRDAALVEPFLDAREFHVAVWGNDEPEALPPVEIDFSGFSDARDRIYTEAWKGDLHSRGYHTIRLICPAPKDRAGWRRRLEEIAVAAYRALGLRDYARIDMRMRADEPQILDVNVNPDLLADGGSAFVAAAAAGGFEYARMVRRIVEYAAVRLPR